MSRIVAITSVLSLALNVAPMFAVQAKPAKSVKHKTAKTAAAPVATAARIETQVPGTTTGAAFINVRRIFSLYGDLIQKVPQYSQVEQAVAAGFPNPAKDLDQVGMVSNIENFAQSSAGVVITGNINMDRLMKFAASQHVTFTPSMFRGVTLMTGKLDNRSTQVGFVDESTTLVSIDPAGEGVHDGTKQIVATLKKEAPSFGEHNLLALPANYLVNLSLQVPAELASGLDEVAGGQFAVLKAVKFLAASIVADEATKDATLNVTATCDTEANATQVHALLQALSGALAGRGGDILQKLKLSVSGKNVTIELTIPRAEMEALVASR